MLVRMTLYTDDSVTIIPDDDDGDDPSKPNWNSSTNTDNT